MSYKRQLRGLGDASSCGAGQTFYGNVTFAGVKGQCLTADQYNTCKSTGMYAGQPCTVDSGSGSSTAGTVGSIVGALLGGLLNKPQPASAPVIVQQGMSTTTKVALIGGGAVLVGLLLARR